MPTVDLYTLSYPRFNAIRTVSYESDGATRRVYTVTGPLNPDEPFTEPGGASQPSSWPYAEGERIRTVEDGGASVAIYATRTTPFARYEATAIGPEPGVVCDLQVFNPQTGAGTFSFQVSTSNGPWRSALNEDLPEAYEQNRSLYTGLPLGAHIVYVRDQGGCATSVSFVISEDEQGGGEEEAGLPSGAILLRLREKELLGEEGYYFEYTGYYYLPSTRATFSRREGIGLESKAYSRPTTEIIDRWCIAPGEPPFREIQVTHDGIGGIVLTPEDGVTACQIRCTVTLSETHQVAEGYGEITVVATAADAGGGRFSLDNFATPGLEGAAEEDTFTATFTELPAGRYTVSFRENRPGGCSASLVVDLSSTYGPRYAHRYRNAAGVLCEIKLLERDYTGEVERVNGGPSPVVMDMPGAATGHVYTQLLKGSECAITFLQTYQEQYLPLFSGDERLYLAEHTTAGQLDWRGYVLPEQYDVAFLNGKQFFSLQATDGLGTLSTLPFIRPGGARVAGDLTLLDVLLLCLSKLELNLPLHVLCSLYPTGADRTRSFLEAVKVDAGQYQSEKGQPWDCGQVVEAILTSFQLRLYQEGGAWWLERLADLTTGPLAYFSYSPNGQALPMVERSLLRFVACDSPLRWQTAAQRQGVRGAVAVVEAREGVGEVVNLLQRFLPTADADVLPAWRGTAPYALVYAGRDKTPTLRITGAAPGLALPVALWLQTPLTSPIPALADASTVIGNYILRFKARAYGNRIVDAAVGTKGEWNSSSSYAIGDRVIRGLNYYSALQNNQGRDPLNSNDAWTSVGSVNQAVQGQAAQLFVSLQVGDKWVQASAGTYDTPDEAATQAIAFADDKEVEVEIRGYAAPDAGSYPLALRIYQPLAGAAPQPVLVDISDLSLTFENTSPQLAESYEELYTLDTGLRVSRVDTDTELYHMDTAYVRRAGTLLDARGLPTATWQENPAGQQKEVGVYFTRDRASFQFAPAQVLTGALRGALRPGALLTDEAEPRTGIYLFTSWQRDCKADLHTITAVQLLTLQPLAEELPEGAIYHEDLTAWAAESGEILLYEDAGV